MDKNFHREFNSCPNCGSTQRFCEQLGEELKEAGMAREEWFFCYDTRQGVVMDKAKQSKLLIGSTLPGFIIHTDICMDCGTIYVTFTARLDGKATPAHLPKPRPDGFGNLPFNNPQAS